MCPKLKRPLLQTRFLLILPALQLFSSIPRQQTPKVAASCHFARAEHGLDPFLHPNSILQLHNSYEEDPTNPRETEEGYLSDDCSPPGGKKRRLNAEQVRTLEKSFDLGNKLEAERKLRLAEDLGFQPRQIAIWFQNRRARWKAKQLEKDYELLKRQFKELKAENDALLCHNKKLYDEIMALKGKEASELLEPINLNKGTEDPAAIKARIALKST
ncbi:hypothetical protein HPP92_016245 [Vanilla planifolia]|uniref:Homeobox-leucine zipper protein n=1 Tax=Vanilla planifolia TaxID=51239 RepID=A0A835UQA7_VANPL|nr:hypothetical protein HPP92_016245 [Vanilla planifolia]